jgi:hypothetical protein
MRKGLLTIALVASLPLVGAHPAGATTPRADAYYEIWCTTAEGDLYLAKRVDARAIQLEKDPGGKDTATDRFNANNPYGEHCFEVGPIEP